jgi:hypothetical protein
LLPGAGGISRLHGERVRHEDRVFVPLYHPAAALYNAGLKETLEADMRRVRGYLADAEAARARRASGASASELREVAAASGGDQMDLF